MAETPSELQGEVEKLERKHAEEPGGRYFVPLANAYRRLARYPEAESLLREGLRRHPAYLSAHIVLGRCLADQGKAGPASEEFRYVLSADPQNLVALRSLGELSLSGGRVEEAGRWYRELLAVDPMNEEARRALDSLGPPSAPDGDIPPEEPALEEAAPEDEEVELVTETIADLYARQGLYERSADVYRELIRRRGDDAGLERRLAEVLRLARPGGAPSADLPAPAIPAEEMPAAASGPHARGERTIAEFLAELAGWHPGDGGAPASGTGDAAAPLPLLGTTPASTAGELEALFSDGDFLARRDPEGTPDSAPDAPPADGSDPVAARDDDDDLESFHAWLRSLKR